MANVDEASLWSYGINRDGVFSENGDGRFEIEGDERFYSHPVSTGAIHHGVWETLKGLRIEGGDTFVKRALYRAIQTKFIDSIEAVRPQHQAAV